MSYNEDTTTREENTDLHDDTLLILDGTVRLDYIDKQPDQIEHKTVIETVAQLFRDFNKK